MGELAGAGRHCSSDYFTMNQGSSPMRNLKLIAAAILAILVAVLVVQNTEPVETHLLFATVAMPHAVLIFISSAAGFALGVLLTMSLRSKRKNLR
jgi:uncharacterized integral membrane protein